MQTMRGSLTNNVAKLEERDKQISKTKLTEFSRCHAAKRLPNLEDKRSSCLEEASTNRENLWSQIRTGDSNYQYFNHI